MMKSVRGEWRVPFTAKDLAVAAEERAAHRMDRYLFWIGKKAEIMEKIKEAGIEVDEGVGQRFSNSTYGRDPKVRINNELADHLGEAHEKVEKHKALHREYEGWVAFLKAVPEERFQLSQEDWLYFFKN